MSHQANPIDHYLQSLGAKLDLSATERAAILEETRAHLEEKAAVLQAAGQTPQEAEQAAVNSFGLANIVARRMNGAHLMRWGWRRWLGGIGLGALLMWVMWVVWWLVAFPIIIRLVYASNFHVLPGSFVTQSDIMLVAIPCLVVVISLIWLCHLSGDCAPAPGGRLVCHMAWEPG